MTGLDTEIETSLKVTRNSEAAFMNLNPEAPFVWPEPRVSEFKCAYKYQPPYEELALASKSVFGIVSAPTAQGIEALESWVIRNVDLKARLVVAVYPTCATRQDDLRRLLEIVENTQDRLHIHVYPLVSVRDRAMNALCFLNSRAESAYIVTGVGEDFGYESLLGHKGEVNFAFRADPALIENFKRYFDWLWANSREITAEGVVVIPDLVLPEGTEEGARLWRSYLKNFNDNPVSDEKPRIVAEVDPVTGDVTLCTEDGQKVTPPTEELGLAKLDPLAEHVARLYAKGALVSIDKMSRIPPLDAPLDPSLFGDAAEKQKGAVTRKVSMRVSIIDNATLREIENRRKALRAVLNKFTFGLADNMRWMPNSARELFEQEVARVNAEGRSLITSLFKGDVENFIAQKRDLLIEGINAWYQELGRQGSVPENAIEHVERSLTERLTKAQSANFMPRLTYSSIAFNNTTNDWASPWGQAFSLLYDIAVFPRKALTDFYFFRGLEISEDDLIEAMNVANDAIVEDRAKPKIKDRCKAELELLKRIEGAAGDARKRCDLVWKLIGGGEIQEITTELENMEKKENA